MEETELISSSIESALCIYTLERKKGNVEGNDLMVSTLSSLQNSSAKMKRQKREYK